MIRLDGCAAGALALFLVLTPATPQAQGQGQGQQGGLTAVQAQVQALEAAVKQLQEEVAAEIAARTAADAAEGLARAAADTTLQGNIDAEAAARTAGDAAESAARAAADTTLQGNIDAEAAARAAADSALQNDIANEAAARAAADTTLQDALQARITTLGDQVTALQQLFESLNPVVNTAQQDIADLRTDLDALEDTVDMLGGGLTSYDQLAGLPCTTASGTEGGTIRLLSLSILVKSPVCGIESENGRFLDFGPVVLDTQENLLWEKKTTAVGSGANVNDLHDVDNRYTWCQATGNSAGACAGNATSWIGQVNAEVFAGFSNWRVPTRDELLTIVDTSVATCGSGTPCIDPIFGPTRASLFYWSSTESGGVSAWYVDFSDGNASSVDKIVRFLVRAVRAGS